MADGDFGATIESPMYTCMCDFEESDTEEVEDGDTEKMMQSMKELNGSYSEALEYKKQNEICPTIEIDELLESWVEDLKEQSKCLLLLNEETEEQGGDSIEYLDKVHSEIKTLCMKTKLEREKNKLAFDNTFYEKKRMDEQCKNLKERIAAVVAQLPTLRNCIEIVKKEVKDLAEIAAPLDNENCWNLSGLQIGNTEILEEQPELIGSPCETIVDTFKECAKQQLSCTELKMEIRLLVDRITNKDLEIEKLESQSKEIVSTTICQPRLLVEEQQPLIAAEKEVQTMISTTKIFREEDQQPIVN